MNNSDPPKPERRRHQFSLWTVLLGLLVISGCGPSKEQQAIDVCNRGIDHFDNGELDKAISDCTKAIHLKPNYAIAYVNRASARLDKGKYDQAIRDCSQAIRVNSQFAQAYYNRGVAYAETGDQAKAEADFAKAKELGHDPE